MTRFNNNTKPFACNIYMGFYTDTTESFCLSMNLCVLTGTIHALSQSTKQNKQKAYLCGA